MGLQGDSAVCVYADGFDGRQHPARGSSDYTYLSGNALKCVLHTGGLGVPLQAERGGTGTSKTSF